jgi:porphobilinogen synthase
VAVTAFPATRLRRLRRTAPLREMVRETRLTPHAFMYPVFVDACARERTEINSMPGQYRWPLRSLRGLAREVYSRGIPSVILFGLPEAKDDRGSGAYDLDGIVQRATACMKDAVPELIVATDTCLDEYTSHGHCGVIRDGDVDNDATLELLARTAVSQAHAGADIIAPSDMMDGRVGVIRSALDESGHAQIPILSYAAKYASSFYGPFRDAADCAPKFGDRRSYQMDPANAREALREVELDLEEGADMVMVKPALPYLDIVREIHTTFNAPVAAYNVSGEYAMLKAAAGNGWLDERSAVLETLTSIARAGASLIVTYHACEAAAWLQE